MNLRYIEFCAIVFWGFSADLLLFAIPIAIILEARHYTKVRWNLDKQDFYRTADLTSVAMLLLIIFLFMNRKEYHFVRTLIEWLPIALFPLVTVLAYSTTERMSLDVLFYSLRRQKEPVTQSWDMNYVFFGLCLVAAGTRREGDTYYILVVAALLLSALYRLRSPRYSMNAWILTALVLFLTATFTHQSIRASHLALKAQTQEWLANFIRNRVNPLRTRSSIGDVGRLKTSDAIMFRVESLTGDKVPSLIQEATYDIPSDNDWIVIRPQFSVVPHVDDFRWRFAPETEDDTEARAKIYLEFNREVSLVPVPSELTEIYDLPAADLRRSAFASIQASGLVPSPGYEVSYDFDKDLNMPPEPSDLFLEKEYKPMLKGLVKTPYEDPITAVQQAFSGFRYSMFQGLPGNMDPLEYFLKVTRAGHCEYFATSTVLLLRSLGVPARYVVGYAVQEYNPTLDMYIVRERHAHAWAIAWNGAEWQVVDTTPQIWAEAEAAQSSIFRPIADFFSNSTFVAQVWWSRQKLEDYENHLYVIGAILLLILIYRIATSEQVIISDEKESGVTRDFDAPGLDSPFFRVRDHLENLGLKKEPGESFRRWLERVGHPELLPMLPIHNRLRFNPANSSKEDLAVLDDQVDDWMSSHSETT